MNISISLLKYCKFSGLGILIRLSVNEMIEISTVVLDKIDLETSNWNEILSSHYQFFCC